MEKVFSPITDLIGSLYDLLFDAANVAVRPSLAGDVGRGRVIVEAFIDVAGINVRLAEQPGEVPSVMEDEHVLPTLVVDDASGPPGRACAIPQPGQVRKRERHHGELTCAHHEEARPLRILDEVLAWGVFAQHRLEWLGVAAAFDIEDGMAEPVDGLCHSERLRAALAPGRCAAGDDDGHGFVHRLLTISGWWSVTSSAPVSM